MGRRKKEENKTKKIRKIILLIYILFMLSVILTNGLSRFRTTYSMKSIIPIARPIANIITEEMEINELHNEEYEINFVVNNYNNSSEINQVTLLYKIQVTNPLENVEYALYKKDGDIETELTLVDDITEQEYELGIDNMQEDKYCLKIKTTDEPKESIENNVIISISAIQKNNG